MKSKEHEEEGTHHGGTEKGRGGEKNGNGYGCV